MHSSKIANSRVQELRAQLQGHGSVLTPECAGYEDSFRRWSDIGCQRPGICVYPADTRGVAITTCFASHHRIDLAVQGGGHSTDISGSTDGGILLNLARMKQVYVDTAAQTITVQGGALWQDVNPVAAEHNLAAVGSTVSSVGVGGFTLCGGYGYLTPQHGLAIDNLLAATVVVADGRVMRASVQENSDLFWALRGAGQNFGVTTEFIFQAYPQTGMVWNGTRAFSNNKTAEVIEALRSSLIHAQGRAAAQCALALSPETSSPITTALLFFNGTAEEAEHHFSRVLQIDCLAEDVRMKPYMEANTVLNSLVPSGGRKKFVGITLPPSLHPQFVQEVGEEVGRQLLNEADMASSALEIDFFDTSKIRSNPIQKTAFAARSGYLRGALILQWTDAEKDQNILAWGKEIQRMCDAECRHAGGMPEKLTTNFSGYTQDDNAEPAEMFGSNTPRLLRAKAEFDPENKFNKMNPLSRVNSQLV